MHTQESPLFFGEWLKRRRQNLDLTQAELAERAGCTVFALRKIESGERRPSKQLAALLAQALEISDAALDAFVAAARGDIAGDRLPQPELREMTRPAPAPARPPSTALRNWPAQLTPLVGREEELTSLTRLLTDPFCRLLTLIGPGGIGKTRLAIEAAARERARFAGGVWFVPLAPVGSPVAIVPAIVEAMGLTLHGQTELRPQLLGHLARLEALLVLDNLEHMLAGVGLFTDILAAAPRVKLIATSRERLHLQSEYVFVTQGLPVPPPDQLHRAHDYDAIRLFAQSARRAGTAIALEGEELAAAAQVCRLVDGMPLGIELAAAWAPLLRCQEIATEIQRSLDFLTTSLHDLPERQRSLRAVFDHSWRLLTSEEREALSRLAIFQGGFERTAAEEVARASLPELLALTSKSLIRRSAGRRYDLHEVVRQYALSHLSQTPAYAETCDCHSRFYLALLRDQGDALRGRDQLQALRHLTAEVDNLRAAWNWAVARDMFDALTRAVRSFGNFFELSGWLSEGVALLEPVIQAGRAAPHDPARQRMLGEALTQQALLLFRRGDFAQARGRTGESLALLRPFADPDLLLHPLLFDGIILFLQGELEEAQARLEEALAYARVVGDSWCEVYADFNLGYLAHLRGDHLAGYTRMCAVLADWRAVGDPRTISLALNHLSPAAVRLGRFQEAEDFLHEGLTLCQQLGDRWGIGTALRYLGLAALAQGDATRAQDLLRRSLDMHRGYVVGWDIAHTLTYLGNASLTLGQIEEARQCYLEAQQRADEAGSRPAALDARMGLAQVEAQAGRPQQALEQARYILRDPASSQEARHLAARLHVTLSGTTICP